ncbi:MAG: cupin domain-containing protein [Granulosicoccus sp.]
MNMKDMTHKILEPMTLDQFFSGYWESQALHVSRNDSDYFTSLLAVSDLETVLASKELYFPAVQLTQKGREIQSGDYTDAQQRILGLRLLQLHAEGATVVLSRAQNLFASLDRLCHEVTRLLKMRCQTNVYFSPPSRQGFNAHYDTHDVFILQLQGEKTFHFYGEAVDLPFVDDTFDRSVISPTEPTESIRLRAGDTLYIPRGVVHDAVAEEHGSLHITLGVFPVVMRDLMQSVVQVVAENDRRCRQAVIPFAEDKAQLQTQLRAMADAMANPQWLEEALLRQQEELSLSVSQDPTGAMSRIRASDDMTGDTVLKLRSCAVIDTQTANETLFVYVFGQVLEFEKPMADAVQFIMNEDSFRAADLAMLSEQQQLALCQRLLRENLLEVVSTGNADLT